METDYKIREYYQQVFQNIWRNSPDGTFTEAEARQVTLLILEHYLSVSQNDILLNKNYMIDSRKLQQVEQAIHRVILEEPVQYIIEEAHFYGRKFKVSPAVLIPRRETEELVHIILKENETTKPDILDIGTGSGCIAITLQKELPLSNMYAWEVDTEAIAIAQHNAAQHQAQVMIEQVDIFQKNLLSARSVPFDIVVSNPPYVRKSEAAHMENNVLKYEPHLALFVADEHPLLFYEQIVELCNNKLLKKGGILYFEVNESLGKEVADLLLNKGMEKVRVLKDLQKKNRFVSGKLPLY